jgi:hypothetical protein
VTQDTPNARAAAKINRVLSKVADDFCCRITHPRVIAFSFQFTDFLVALKQSFSGLSQLFRERREFLKGKIEKKRVSLRNFMNVEWIFKEFCKKKLEEFTTELCSFP